MLRQKNRPTIRPDRPIGDAEYKNGTFGLLKVWEKRPGEKHCLLLNRETGHRFWVPREQARITRMDTDERLPQQRRRQAEFQRRIVDRSLELERSKALAVVLPKRLPLEKPEPVRRDLGWMSARRK